MPSAAASFTLGIVTATAIAAGFAGTFMDSVAKKSATDELLRPPVTAATQAKIDSTAQRPAVAPSTAGFAPAVPAAAQVAARSPSQLLPSESAVPARKGADANAAEAWPNPSGDHVSKKEPRKRTAKPVKRKPPLYENRNFAAQRERSGWGGGGLFGLFR